MQNWNDTVRNDLRALRYWRLFTDGIAIFTVAAVGFGAILWFLEALPTP